jgi:hypothetical protein
MKNTRPKIVVDLLRIDNAIAIQILAGLACLENGILIATSLATLSVIGWVKFVKDSTAE